MVITLGSILKLLHIASAIAMIGGMIGRQVARAQAERSSDVHEIKVLIRLATRFDRIVIPSSNLLLVFGVAVALVNKWPLGGFLQGSPMNWLLVSILLFVAMIPIIAIVFIPHRKALERALDEATDGNVTPELRALLQDRRNMIGHRIEEIIIGIILILMVLKPF